jgi:arginine/lysine/ornithine decarboxylase
MPEGVLAIHISNRYLDLAPLLYEFAKEKELPIAVISTGKTDSGGSAASWVLMTRNKDFINQPEINPFFQVQSSSDQKVRLWTDSYSNMLPFLRMEGVFNR